MHSVSRLESLSPWPAPISNGSLASRQAHAHVARAHRLLVPYRHTQWTVAPRHVRSRFKGKGGWVPRCAPALAVSDSRHSRALHSFAIARAPARVIAKCSPCSALRTKQMSSGRLLLHAHHPSHRGQETRFGIRRLLRADVPLLP